MSTSVQPCARCGARWTVQARPLHWCPRCGGVLLSPGPIDAPAQRRNYRWVARRPDHRVRKPTSRAAASTETPRYTRIPRWGLFDVPPQAPAAAQRPLGLLTGAVSLLLIGTAVLFVLAAAAEFGRYLILLRNRTRLIENWLLIVSDVSVYLFALGALVLALLSALALVGWLIEVRRAAYGDRKRRDPRSVFTLVLGCLIPVANLLWPGVFLTETARIREDPRALRAARIWWCGWILNGLLVVAALLWRNAGSLQAEADGVSLTALTDLVAAAMAVLTLWMMRMVEGRDLFGRIRTARRWVLAVDPAVPVIEPVQPGGGGGKATPPSVGEVGAEEPAAEDVDSGASDSGVRRDEHKEVIAK